MRTSVRDFLKRKKDVPKMGTRRGFWRFHAALDHQRARRSRCQN